MRGFKVASITLVSHISKMLVSLYIIKQLAVIYGPEGLGVFGNFMSLIAISSSLAGGGIVSGIIKYLSEYSNQAEIMKSFLGSSLLYSMGASIFVLILGFIFIKPLTTYIFIKAEYAPYLIFFLIMQILIAFNNFTFGVVNGLKKNGAYALIMVIGNIFSFFFAFAGIHHFGVWGAIIAIMAPLIFPFIPAVIYTISQRSLKNIRFNSFNHDSKLLAKFSLMLIVSSICFPIVEIIIRTMLINKLGLESAGYWQAITRLSSAYLSFYSLFLTFYFVPIISALVSRDNIYTEVKKMLGMISVIFIMMIAIFSLFKNDIIYYALSEQFVPISDLFLLQMLGDFLRVLGWVFGFIIVAKAATKLYIWGEILQGILFLSFTYFELTYCANLQSVIFAYIGTCALYLMITLTGFYFFYMKKTFIRCGIS